jgi:hypothetical protein
MYSVRKKIEPIHPAHLVGLEKGFVELTIEQEEEEEKRVFVDNSGVGL